MSDRLYIFQTKMVNMENKLILKHQNSNKSLTEKNVRPVPSIVTKSRDKKKNIGIPKMIGL